jgi:hypothetical protein
MGGETIIAIDGDISLFVVEKRYFEEFEELTKTPHLTVALIATYVLSIFDNS